MRKEGSRSAHGEKGTCRGAASRAALFAFSSIKIIGDGRDENDDCQSASRPGECEAKPSEVARSGWSTSAPLTPMSVISPPPLQVPTL